MDKEKMLRPKSSAAPPWPPLPLPPPMLNKLHTVKDPEEQGTDSRGRGDLPSPLTGCAEGRGSARQGLRDGNAITEPGKPRRVKTKQ